MAVLSAVVKSVRTKGDLVEFAIENSRESVHPKKIPAIFLEISNFYFIFQEFVRYPGGGDLTFRAGIPDGPVSGTSGHQSSTLMVAFDCQGITSY